MSVKKLVLECLMYYRPADGERMDAFRIAALCEREAIPFNRIKSALTQLRAYDGFVDWDDDAKTNRITSDGIKHVCKFKKSKFNPRYESIPPGSLMTQKKAIEHWKGVQK